MNCKPGDLAVIVRAKSPYRALGRIVRVLRAAVEGERYRSECGCVVKGTNASGCWVVACDTPLIWEAYDGTKRKFRQRPVHDTYLRPIRDSDGTDETLIYAGKPRELEQA